MASIPRKKGRGIFRSGASRKAGKHRMGRKGRH